MIAPLLTGPMVLSQVDEYLSNVDEPKMFTVITECRQSALSENTATL